MYVTIRSEHSETANADLDAAALEFTYEDARGVYRLTLAAGDTVDVDGPVARLLQPANQDATL